MSKISHQISGTGSAPVDQYILVVTAFIYCEVLEVQLKAIGLHDLVDGKPKALSEDEIIRTLKTKLQSLNAQGM